MNGGEVIVGWWDKIVVTVIAGVLIAGVVGLWSLSSTVSEWSGIFRTKFEAIEIRISAVEQEMREARRLRRNDTQP